RLKIFGLAMPFYPRMLDFHWHALFCGLYSEHGGKYLGFFSTACMADRHTSVASINKHFFKTLDHIPYFFKRLLFADNHCCSLLFDPFCLHITNQTGDGPSVRILAVNSVQISAHLGPMAADRLYISKRAGSMANLDNRFFKYLILRAAYVLPSR